jgi:solute:Na+ symporter, SSS family
MTINLHLVILSAYSLGLMALGLWLGRRVRTSADFLVAGRQLGPGLIFSTMLAANIGAGSTVSATAQGYLQGVAAAWWVGSAAIGSLALALWIGPAMRRVAAANDLRSVGDYLEFRYSASVRGIISLLLWIGAIFILASQLIGLGWILNVVANVPTAVGCAVGGLVITVYFMAGGLLTSARVNVVQLFVKLAGFAVAVPLTVGAAGGWSAIAHVRGDDPAYWTFWRADVAAGYFFAFAPAFVISPGLLQKVLGARDDRAVRVGVGLNALGLFLYAGVPVLLGVICRGLFTPLADSQQALPLVLMRALPPLIGAVGVAAVFSAEISAADAVLLMLTTSLSRDLYKRFLAPDAPDGRVLRVARGATLVSAIFAVALAITSASIVALLTIFYTLMTVSLFVPIVAGLFRPSTSARDALASILAGVSGMLIIQFATHGRGWGIITPALGGLAAASAAWAVSSSIGAAHVVVVSDRSHRR